MVGHVQTLPWKSKLMFTGLQGYKQGVDRTLVINRKKEICN